MKLFQQIYFAIHSNVMTRKDTQPLPFSGLPDARLSTLVQTERQQWGQLMIVHVTDIAKSLPRRRTNWLTCRVYSARVSCCSEKSTMVYMASCGLLYTLAIHIKCNIDKLYR